ncbi:STAS domain-containing protein [Geodermatophilus normandii]|uniref:STAS domain-containing protein n=1 Tax=Geodermatophilus normandii TaxID=1137989 RepID=A0A6P0GIH8_9ACTN|nr:hypothetical protein [Geodermatophilus normandii]NEM07064.1 hypothetical protein [Geodermatophilus normandii]
MRTQTRRARHRGGRAVRGALLPGRPGTPVGSTSSGQPDGLTVYVNRLGLRPVVVVAGELDTCGAALLSAVLDDVRVTEGRAAEVDLAAVEYADSHGLAPLLDGQATIRRASPVVRRLLGLLHAPRPRAAAGEPLVL